MRTEDDLRTLFHDTAAAITLDDLVATPPHPDIHRQASSHSRRRIGILAAAAVIVAAVLTAAVLARGYSKPGFSGAPSGPTWASSMTVPPGWTLETRTLNRGGTESISLRSPSGISCSATTGAGTPPVALLLHRTRQVAGHRGEIGPIWGRGGPDTPLGMGPGQHARWEPTKGRWADVTCDNDGSDLTNGLDLAAQLEFGPDNARLPVSLSDLPGGLAVNQVIIQHDMYPSSDAPRVMMPLLTNLGQTPQPSLNPDQAQRGHIKTVLAIVEKRSDYTQGVALEESDRIPDINGRTAWLQTSDPSQPTVRDLVIADDGYVLWLSSGDYSGEQLIQIARSMQLTHPLGDQTTWRPSLIALGNR